jgi:hypothetical protein
MEQTHVIIDFVVKRPLITALQQIMMSHSCLCFYDPKCSDKTNHKWIGYSNWPF